MFFYRAILLRRDLRCRRRHFQGTTAIWLRFFTRAGVLVPTGEENAEAAHTRAEAAHAQAEAERTRAEAEHIRAEAERGRAEAAEAENARLRAELARLRNATP